jgi:hypothetical protein
MVPLKQREERKTVFVRARLRTDHGWSDVTIGNVSSRGLMLQCMTTPRRNEIVEVCHRNLCIVGRIVWTRGAKCGVRTQDKIDVPALLSHAPVRRRLAGEERRSAPRRGERPRRMAAVVETADASRRFARVLEWTVVAAGSSAAAVLVAQIAFSTLDAPLDRAETALAQID